MSRFRTIHYLGEKVFKQPDSAVCIAKVRYSEGPGFESRSGNTFLGCTFFSPCDIWRSTWGHSSLSRVSHCFSVSIGNWRRNFNTAGEYVTVQNCSLFRGESVYKQLEGEVEPLSHLWH
jgi:hypothetical protein